MRKVVLLYSTLLPSVRLCGYEQFKYIGDQGKIQFDAIPLKTVKTEQLRDADAVTFVRGDSKLEVSLAKQLKQAGKYLIYALDDDLLNIPDYISSAAHYHQRQVQKNIADLMDLSDCLITPSPQIIEKYGKRFSKTVLIEEPAACCTCRRVRTDRCVKIGFAGSVDRAEDFDSILGDALRRLKKKLGDQVCFEFFGAKPAVAEELGCKCIPYVDSYQGYQNVMRGLDWDIGLAPMPDTEFHSCKHYNKFIEYGSHGMISVCSAQLPYTRIIKDWENGVLCSNESSAWEDALMELVSHPELRQRLADRLYRQIKDEFQISTVSMRLWEELDPYIPELSHYEMHSIAKCRIEARIDQIKRAAMLYRWKFPIVVMRKVWSKLFGSDKS